MKSQKLKLHKTEINKNLFQAVKTLKVIES